MVLNTTMSARETNLIDRRKSGLLGYDFALLGLRAKEARVEVIRRAARETAEKIQDRFPNKFEQDGLIGELATSTYRLLDPRKRSEQMERVQLSVFSEADLELQKLSSRSLLAPETNLVVAELAD
ncbi:MAG: hypothetical protein KDB22_21405 [Planctomycetales bacterium]|nr:hypothetical protein [Planctomycetales bacterium]